jgi:hypothetical protein
VSVEVAEHLSRARADTFVADLTALAPLVLFSAAIPGQGGVEHLNEQWPAFWIDRFRHRGFEPIDCIRLAVWDDQQVDPWYAQNCLLFARADDDRLGPLRLLSEAGPRGAALVHPVVYYSYLYEVTSGSFRSRLPGFLASLRDAVVRRLSAQHVAAPPPPHPAGDRERGSGCA